MQIIDLQEFECYLRERRLVDDAHMPHYVRWVNRFLQGPGADHHLEPKDQVIVFRDMLQGSQRCQDWQVRQAVRAVELYLKNYLPTQQTSPRKSSAIAPAEDPVIGSVSAPAGTASTLPAAIDRPHCDLPAKASTIPVPSASGSPAPSAAGDAKSAASTDAATTTPGDALIAMQRLIRIRHYSYATETTYLDWVRRFFAFSAERRLDWQTADTVRCFLSSLALDRNVAAPTQNQAFCALVFLFREVMQRPDHDFTAVRARTGTRLPVVLTEEEVTAVFRHVNGVPGLMLKLTYGGGLRVSECIRLRVKDLDFDQTLLVVREGKGDKDRTTLLSRRLIEPLKQHLEVVKAQHQSDLAIGVGDVYLPHALAVKYPRAGREWGWQYVFPAADLAVDPRGGAVRRHHLDAQILQRVMRDAVRQAGIVKPASVHTLRHSFATALLLHGTNIRELQQYLGHVSVETTMIYTHVIRNMGRTAESPFDLLEEEAEGQNRSQTAA